MKKTRILAVVVCVLAVANIASADTVRGIDINFVTIGNAGNTGDTRLNNQAYPYNCGAVGYNYRIGKYEITNAQWNTFTAAAGAPTGNDGGYSYNSYWTGDQQPTNRVSWYEAIQLCNWLTSGDKSKGAYLFSGNNTNPGNFLGINRAAAQATHGMIYFLPTENEWYKAAYYKPNGSGYSSYANGTDTAPLTSEACYGQSLPYPGPWNIGIGTIEQNGTFDMMGNVWEWNETLISSSNRGIRGGSYRNAYDTYLSSSYRDYYYPSNEYNNIGFRVIEIPEPATILLLTLGGLVLRKHRR